MDPLIFLGYVFLAYLIIYLIARTIGIERLQARGIDAGTPLFIMIRTERLNAFLTRMGKKIPRAFFNFGVVVAVIGMAFGFWLFGTNLWNFFFAPAAAGGVVPLIPGVTITGLPVIYMIIGLAVTLLTHEFSHALAASRDDIKVKSSGLLFFYVIFGGFVEPDEDDFENNASTHDRLRMLAAGSYANLIVGFIFLLLIINFSPLMSIAFNQPSGSYIYDVSANSPADGAIQIGDVITGLNDTVIAQWGDVHTFMASTKNGTQLTVHTLEGSVDIILGSNPSNSSLGYIGVYGADYWEPKTGWEWIPGGPMYAFHAQLTLTWSFMILFSVALFNLLPIPALDGDKLLSNGLSLVTKNEKLIKRIMLVARVTAFSIIILSIGLTIFTGKMIF